MTPIRVVLADDQAVLRAGVRVLLDSHNDIEVVGESGTGREAVDLVRELKPDVVLMDIRMPDGDGLWATEQLAADPDVAETRVVVFTTFEMDEYVFRALRAGASGFVGKAIRPEELADGIRTVMAGESLLSPTATTALVGHFLGQPRLAEPTRPALVDVLTEREREVVALVGQGMTNEEIAAHLVLSPLTAKTHVNRSMTKLGVRDRAQLVVLAYRSGLVRA